MLVATQHTIRAHVSRAPTALTPCVRLLRVRTMWEALLDAGAHGALLAPLTNTERGCSLGGPR
eukprot:12280782-Prorocentrum_lima.AAC.1